MKIYLDVVGCRLNQSEVEGIANTFRALGHKIVQDPAMADLAIINTCAVTVKAAADSRKQLRRAVRGGAQEVIATGCWASLYPAKAKNLPGVSRVFSNDQKGFLVEEVLNLKPEVISNLNLVREPLPGNRARTRAFIKVQEGCDNFCAYCLTRVARGKSRSRNLKDIKRDIWAALTGGAKEIVLTGVQLGAWGRDLHPQKSLTVLIESVLAISEINRLRFSSIEPWDFDEAMLSFWGDQRLCRHVHIPLQSGSNKILEAMGRPLDIEGYVDLIEMIRTTEPEIAITTDVITGFPGETEDEFIQTTSIIQKLNFAGGHVFTYSPRPGTPAYQMKDPVPVHIAKERNAVLRDIFRRTSQNFRDGFIGKMEYVLWESSDQGEEGAWMMSGLTDTYIRVYGRASANLWNQLSLVSLKTHHPERQALIGQIIRHKG